MAGAECNNPPDEFVIERVVAEASQQIARQSDSSAALSVALGRIAAEVFFWSGR